MCDVHLYIYSNSSTHLQANYKIQGAKIQYDIYALCLRLRDTTFRAEHEEKVRLFFFLGIILIWCSEKNKY